MAEYVLNIHDSYPTVASFLMILAFEEIGKGICLIEEYEKGNDLSEKEWGKLSKYARAHKKKLEIVHRTLLDQYSLLKPHELSVKLNEMEEFKHNAAQVARQIHDFKLDIIYVNWNENEDKWDTPLEKKTYDENTFDRLVAATRLLSQKLGEYENPNKL